MSLALVAAKQETSRDSLKFFKRHGTNWTYDFSTHKHTTAGSDHQPGFQIQSEEAQQT